MSTVLAIDAGTTGVRTLAVHTDGTPGPSSYREFPQHFPQPGWVEHDVEDIWAATLHTLHDVVEQCEAAGESIAAIGITNQRETTVIWNRRTGRPLHHALVWQDRRTAERCDELRAAGHEAFVRQRTGLVLDPYFSATKLAWLCAPAGGGVQVDADTIAGTIDTYLTWKLTGGAVHATDPSNASRTSLYDIHASRWSDDLCALFDAPARVLPEVRPSSGDFGRCSPDVAAGLSVPIAGIAGDQQAALFGQACFDVGMIKNTYGTGSFLLMNIGSVAPPPAEGLLTTIAWDLGHGPVYALEGSIFVTGAAIQWLRDGLRIIEQAAEIGPLASGVDDTDGLFFVPAFTGLGSPWWDPYARGMMIGISRGTTRAHLARATVESMVWQTKDVVDAMLASTGGASLGELRIDGGASVMDLLGQLQADALGATVARPRVQETTAFGAAYLAGLGTGVWNSTDDIAARWLLERRFEPDRSEAGDRFRTRHRQWTRALDRARRWDAPRLE